MLFLLTVSADSPICHCCSVWVMRVPRRLFEGPRGSFVLAWTTAADLEGVARPYNLAFPSLPFRVGITLPPINTVEILVCESRTTPHNNTCDWFSLSYQRRFSLIFSPFFIDQAVLLPAVVSIFEQTAPLKDVLCNLCRTTETKLKTEDPQRAQHFHVRRRLCGQSLPALILKTGQDKCEDTLHTQRHAQTHRHVYTQSSSNYFLWVLLLEKLKKCT